MTPTTSLGRWAACVAVAAAMGVAAARPSGGSDLPEYRVKAGFIYNFMAYTEWPAATPATLTVCIYGKDAFGDEIDSLRGKALSGRSIAVERVHVGRPLANCQVVFIAQSAMDSLSTVLTALRGQVALTVSDTPGAVQQGVAIAMSVAEGKVTFEANLRAARAAGLTLSSKLLRLATEVLQ